MSTTPKSGWQEAHRRAVIMRDVLLKHGVPEVSIELQVGRPSQHDAWNTCKPVAVMSHHIASYPTPANPTPGLALVKNGRSDLEGPLCNGTAGVDLVYRIICMGYANHSGEGGPLTVRGPLGAYSIPEDDGRPYIWGTEYEGGYDDATWNRTYTNARTGKSMSFREFMGRCNAGLVEAIWLINGRGKIPAKTMDLSSYHMEHKTWAGDRKVDRRGYTTDSGRAELRKWAPKINHETEAPEQPKLKKVNLSNVRKAAKGKIKRSLPGVVRVQQALNSEHPSADRITEDGKWDDQCTRRYRRFQKEHGTPDEKADGIPTRRDLELLGKGRFIVRD